MILTGNNNYNNINYILEDNFSRNGNWINENSKLDILEKSETEFDIEYKKLINENKIILIDITNTSLQYAE